MWDVQHLNVIADLQKKILEITMDHKLNISESCLTHKTTSSHAEIYN